MPAAAPGPVPALSPRWGKLRTGYRAASNSRPNRNEISENFRQHDRVFWFSLSELPMLAHLKSLARREEGNVAVVVAVALVPLMGATGLALDYNRTSHDRAGLQSAADSAALAALLADSPDKAGRVAAATQVFKSNASASLDTALDVKVSDTEAEVTVSGQVTASFMKVLGTKSMPVSAYAKAVLSNDGPPACIMALSTSGTGIDIGGNASVTAKNCALYSNSSISIGGSSAVSTAGYCAAGTVSSSYKLSPDPRNSCPQRPDPYGDLKAPASIACEASKKNVSVGPNQDVTLSGGVYCGGLDLKGTATLNAGLYVIRDGALTINSKANVTGEGVTFYLVGSDATFTINGGGKISLKAPTDAKDPYRGLLIVQDRDSPASGSKLNGNSDTVLVGAIYAPTQQITLNGTGTFGQGSPYMPIVANTVKINGNNTTVVNLDPSIMGTQAPLPQMPGGVRLAK